MIRNQSRHRGINARAKASENVASEQARRMPRNCPSFVALAYFSFWHPLARFLADALMMCARVPKMTP